MLCTAGNQLVVEFWNIHPCNTFTTNDEWVQNTVLTSPVRVRESLVTNEYFWARTLDASKVNAHWVEEASK